VKWLKCLILVGFDDMGYDMGLGREDWVFWLILLEILEIRFLSWCVKESAIWIPGKTSCGSGFCHPLHPTTTVFYNFSVFGIDNSGLSEQNIIEYLFEYNFIVFLKFIIDNHTYM